VGYRGCEQVQPIADDGEQPRARFRQRDGSRTSAEQALPAVPLETADLVADGRRRHVKLCCGKVEASEAGNGFEGAKCAQGR
jgi:hypothetical protein